MRELTRLVLGTCVTVVLLVMVLVMVLALQTGFYVTGNERRVLNVGST